MSILVVISHTKNSLAEIANIEFEDILDSDSDNSVDDLNFTPNKNDINKAFENDFIRICSKCGYFRGSLLYSNITVTTIHVLIYGKTRHDI